LALFFRRPKLEILHNLLINKTLCLFCLSKIGFVFSTKQQIQTADKRRWTQKDNHSSIIKYHFQGFILSLINHQ